MKQLTPAFLYPLTGVAAIASLASCAGEKKSAQQYNIVYIMTDDHTAHMMSCYGGLIETPNLDRIANDGVIFTNSFVANSLSGPSRASMLTGIGFTVSMFIADLSYYHVSTTGSTLLNDAKLGILCGSVVAGLLGWTLLSLTLPQYKKPAS